MTNNFSKELPEDIMLLILPRLYLSDYLRCRAVSRSWLSIIDRAIFAGKRCPPPSPRLPFLMFRSSGGGEKDHCFLSPSEDLKVYKYSHPDYDMSKLDCVGSIEGWLIMVDHTCSTSVANFFLNPLSGDKVSLPSQTTIPCCGGDSNQASSLSKVIASSAPTNNPNSCLVAAICSQRRGLAFCRPTDKSWTLIEALEDVDDIEIVDGKLYAITTTGGATSENLHAFDIHFDDTNFNEDVPRHTFKAERLIWRWPDLKCSLACYRHTERDGVCKVNYLTFSILKFYLFKDSASNELLMVSVLVSHPSSASNGMLHGMLMFDDIDDTNFVIPPNRWGIGVEAFQAFRLEHNSNGPPRWVEVFELGDRILFLSKTTKLFIPITNNPYGLPHDKTRLEGNRIYFAFGRWKLHDLGVFSLTDNTIQHYTIPKDHSPTRHTPPAWFTPNL